jgi:uncharacterized protein YaaN involved in tellurite resistance
MNNEDERYNVSQEKPTVSSMSSKPIPTLTSVQSKANATYSVGTIDEEMLTTEEKESIERLANEIDVSNVDQIVKFGVDTQRNISDFSLSILKKVKTYDMGEVGESLKDLTVALDATVEPEKKGIFKLLKPVKRGVSVIRANYAKAESNVDRIEQDLLRHEEVLVQDISVYQQMYELNLQYYKDLTVYIFAGKKALDDARAGRLVELKKTADKTNKQEDAQAYRDFEDLCHRFEKKIADLEITRVIAIQAAPQVRMLQNNDRELLDKLQSAIANTIPLWRNQLVLSLGIEHTRRSLEAQNTLTDKTNALLLKNSEMLKMATVETAKATERPIVDVETLRQCNRDLIESINEVVKIHEQGAIKREKAQEELIRIEAELKQTMLEEENT